MDSPPLGAFLARRPPLCVKEALDGLRRAVSVRGCGGSRCERRARCAVCRCRLAAATGCTLSWCVCVRFLGVCVWIVAGLPSARFAPRPARPQLSCPARPQFSCPARPQFSRRALLAAVSKRSCPAPPRRPSGVRARHSSDPHKHPRLPALARATCSHSRTPRRPQFMNYNAPRHALFQTPPPPHPPTNPICTSRDSLPVSSSRPPPLIPPPPQIPQLPRARCGVGALKRSSGSGCS